jgi:hypothetical protein
MTTVITFTLYVLTSFTGTQHNNLGMMDGIARLQDVNETGKMEATTHGFKDENACKITMAAMPATFSQNDLNFTVLEMKCVADKSIKIQS